VSGAAGHGPPDGRCRCQACRDAHAAYQRRRTYLVATGRWHPWADAAPVRDHVLRLRAARLTIRQIAAAADVGQTLVYGLLRGGQSRIRSRQAAALLAVPPRPGTAGNLRGTARVAAAGTARRLQALMVVGWPAAYLAGRVGYETAALRRLAGGQQPMTLAGTAATVRGLYDELWDMPGPSARTRVFALRRGWVPPMAWDDDEIDDPAAQPQGAAAAAGNHGRVAALVESSEELIAQGLTLAQAADRLRVPRNSLERARLRRGLRLTPSQDAA